MTQWNSGRGEVFKAKAKENLVLNGGDNKSEQISAPIKSIETRKELAKIANVGHDTIAKVQGTDIPVLSTIDKTEKHNTRQEQAKCWRMINAERTAWNTRKAHEYRIVRSFLLMCSNVFQVNFRMLEHTRPALSLNTY